jgi:hypothetical protein
VQLLPDVGAVMYKIAFCCYGLKAKNLSQIQFHLLRCAAATPPLGACRRLANLHPVSPALLAIVLLL